MKKNLKISVEKVLQESEGLKSETSRAIEKLQNAFKPKESISDSVDEELIEIENCKCQ